MDVLRDLVDALRVAGGIALAAGAVLAACLLWILGAAIAGAWRAARDAWIRRRFAEQLEHEIRLRMDMGYTQEDADERALAYLRHKENRNATP